MDKFVTKTGKIFQAGDYPDKKFRLTAEELPGVVARFKNPVPLDLDHKSTIKRLDSKLGNLTKIWHDDKGGLFGSVEIPEWLNNVVCKDEKGEDVPLGVSCAFAQSKDIRKLALTDNPRVGDAAIFAAFSAAHPDEAVEELTKIGEGELETEKFSSNLIKELVEFAKKNGRTNAGQSLLQQIHDTLARAGAVCTQTTDLHSAAELSAIQQAHDEMIAAGASCQFLKEGEQPSMWFSSELSEQPADDKTEGDNMDSERLSFISNLLKFATGGESATVEAPAKEVAAPVVAPAKTEETKKEEAQFASPDVAQLRADLEAERKKTEKLIADGIAAQSKILANEIIVGKKAQEKDRAALEVAFSQALTDDQANPAEIQFSADKKGNRVDALKALFSARTVVSLTEETVNEEETETLLSDENVGKKDETQKRLEAVRERAAKLAERKNKSIRK